VETYVGQTWWATSYCLEQCKQENVHCCRGPGHGPAVLSTYPMPYLHNRSVCSDTLCVIHIDFLISNLDTSLILTDFLHATLHVYALGRNRGLTKS
jgi:hypothetical protein